MEAQKQAFDEMNFGRAVDTVLNAKINGVHATLAQLGQVDKEYSLALEIAMGGRMANIVVDDDEVAKIAIEILKSAGAGRATFLPMNKINKAPRSLRLPKDKGVIDFAINLIDFDDEYLNVFYHALGETLVVDDYNSARKLIGQYRMVTLSGEMFEKSGSISGGSQKRSGLKFSQTQDDELLKYKEKYKAFEKQYSELETKKAELETKLDKVRIAYSNSMNAYNQAKIELDNLLKNSQENEKNIIEKKELIAESEPKVKKLEADLDKIEQLHFEINEKTVKLEEQISEIESKMTPEELTKLKKLTEETENQIKNYDSKIGICRNDIDGFERTINFQLDIIETHKKDIDRLLKDNENLAQDKSKYKLEKEDLKIKIDTLEAKIKELGEILIELQTERDEVNNQYLELDKQKNVLILNVEKIAEQIEAFKSRRRELEPQLENIKEELKENGVDYTKLEETEISVEEITGKIQRLQKRMDDLGDVNMLAIKSYDEVSERQNEYRTRIETLSHEKNQIMDRMQGYENLKKDTFMNTYNNINDNFKEIFHKLSEGEGTLFLDNPDAPFSGGMSIEAQPRDKEKTRLNLMSGGEKSLTALAFVFAIQRYLPAPFYAFDEVDANLDGINVEKLADMVKTQAENTQFVVVSHRKPMIESANRTIGVTQKEKGITRVTGVKLRD
jgi:chromosome segregation protein